MTVTVNNRVHIVNQDLATKLSLLNKQVIRIVKMSSFSNIFLNVTKAFLNTNPSIDNVIAFANVDDMLIPLEINQTQINMSKPPNVPHDKFAALFLPQEYFEERKKKNHSFSQESCAAEIRSISGHTCHLNQSVVSKMLKGQYMQKRERRLFDIG